MCSPPARCRSSAFAPAGGASGWVGSRPLQDYHLPLSGPLPEPTGRDTPKCPVTTHARLFDSCHTLRYRSWAGDTAIPRAGLRACHGVGFWARWVTQESYESCAWPGLYACFSGLQVVLYACVRLQGGLGWAGLGRGLHRRQVPMANVSFPH